MPEMSLFYGIRVTMYYDDHNPPYFHAEYNGHKAIIEIDEARCIKGALPSRQLKLILAWCVLHQDELMQNWELSKDGNDKSLRGAYFEYYVFKLLNLLRDEKVIDEVIWNGKIGRYGLPVQAPGGKTGTPDLVFIIDDVHIVLELTTIKPKAMQFSAEGSSVPDHIRLYKQEIDAEVTGVFCAPTKHDRNTAAMQSTIAPYGIELHCITDKELVELLLSKDRDAIKKLSIVTKMRK